MPYTAQKPAPAGKVIALSVTETLFALSWGSLGGAVLIPFTGHWYAGILPALLLAVYFLAKMEVAEETGPLLAFELRQYSRQRRRDVTLWRTFSRLILTVFLTPLILPACITLLLKTRSVPELLTGIKFSQADRRLDPRPPRVIEERRQSSLSRSRILIAVPLAVSLAVFALVHSVPAVVNIQEVSTDNELPEHERELLASYLEMTTLHPEELEYHVRLASLYYRNQMDDDLQNQLNHIREIDPNHAILLLADTTEFSFELLTPDSSDSVIDMPVLLTTAAEPVAQDSTEADSLDETVSDSLSLQPDTLIEQPDTLTQAAPDSVADSPLDTTTVVTPDIQDETAPADTADVETAAPEDMPEPVETETDATITDGEENLEPDTLIQP